jgi:hypothetical protein
MSAVIGVDNEERDGNPPLESCTADNETVGPVHIDRQYCLLEEYCGTFLQSEFGGGVVSAMLDGVGPNQSAQVCHQTSRNEAALLLGGDCRGLIPEWLV